MLPVSFPSLCKSFWTEASAAGLGRSRGNRRWTGVTGAVMELCLVGGGRELHVCEESRVVGQRAG